MKEQRMYGLWPSPISGKSLATSLRLSEPCWDTDGKTLAWLEGRSDRGVIVVQEGESATRDLTPGDMSVRAFVGYGGGDFTLSHGVCYFVGQADQRIYRQPLVGGPPRPITPGFGAAASPTVSPDGRWLAYVSVETGVPQIYVRPFPETKVAKRQVSVNGGLAARWSRSGRELFFADTSDTIWSVPVPPGPVFSPGIPKELFSASQYAPMAPFPFDVSHDDRRFLFTRPVGSQAQRSDELVVVENFIEELKSKVPR